MKIETKERQPKPVTYPMLMQGRSGIVKLFVNATDGVILRGDGGSDCVCVRLGMMEAEPGKDVSLGMGEAVPATDSYWRPYEGSITLSNE